MIFLQDGLELGALWQKGIQKIRLAPPKLNGNKYNYNIGLNLKRNGLSYILAQKTELYKKIFHENIGKGK